MKASLLVKWEMSIDGSDESSENLGRSLSTRESRQDASDRAIYIHGDRSFTEC